MPTITASIIILSIIIIVLVIVAKQFLQTLGIQTTDFISFIKADQKINKIYNLSKKYNSLSLNDKLMFLDESQRLFDAFSKIPDRLWEAEYNKYMEILDTYQKVKVDNWKHGNKEVPDINAYRKNKIKRDIRRLGIKGNSIKTKKISEEF